MSKHKRRSTKRLSGPIIALRAAADHANIKTVALLSPGMNLWEVGLDDVMPRYGQRPVLLIASEEDDYPAESAKLLDEQALGEHRLHIYPGAVHGTDLFDTEADLQPMLLEWLENTLPTNG